MRLSFCLPCMEPDGSELCFISHPASDRRVQCKAVFGNLTMVGNWQDWEVWRFTRKDDGTYVISSWTHQHRILSSNHKGEINSSGDKENERWRIGLHPQTRGLLIQSVHHGGFLASDGGGLYMAANMSGERGTRTLWHLEPAHKNQFVVSATSCDKRLSICNGSDSAVEKWIIEPSLERIGSFSLRSSEHKHFLGSSRNGHLCTTKEAEEWVVVSSSHREAGVRLQSSKFPTKCLAVDANEGVYLTEASGYWETWLLKPILPKTTSERQIWSWVGIGATTITLAAVAPFAVAGVVGAMGFQAGGVAAGSMAAGMMSAEAVASGGAIAAGGTVATLQSIGAAGLGAAGVTASVGAGAAVGGAASVGIAAAANNGLEATQPSADALTSRQHLPLCSWRQW